MTNKAIIKERMKFDENASNHHVANTMLGMTVMYFCSWIANELGFFYVDKTLMRLSILTVVLFLVAPAIYIRKGKLDDDSRAKYLLLGGISVATLIVLVLLNFHATLIIVYPLVISTFYYSKKFNRITVVITMIIAILGVCMAYELKTFDTSFLAWLMWAFNPEYADMMTPEIKERVLNIGISPMVGLLLFYGLPHALFVLGYALITGSANRKRIVDQIEWVDELSKVETEKDKAIGIADAKASFLATMSHEIRTPINAVLGMNTEILRETKEDNIRSYASDVDNAGKLLLSLVNDILDYSKLDAEKMELNLAPYHIKSVITTTYNLVAERAKDKGLVINLDIDEKLPTGFVGDEVRIQQIITNILTNAIKYTHNGSVTYKASFGPKDGKECLIVSIKDTGMGIREEDIDKLFTAFDRIEEKKNAHIEGTGLGLSITSKLVKLMGGQIDVESEYGKGSTFTISVPQIVSDMTPIGKFDLGDPAEHATAVVEKDLFVAPSVHVLVVDDVPMNIKVTRTLLRKTAVRIDSAESGEQAIEMVKNNSYDIILLDHQMPNKDGIQTLHEMRALPGNPIGKTPVIALTANYTAGAKEMYLSEGFSDYLSKPFTITSIQRMLLKHISSLKIAKML